ncbi:MAG: DUF2993 domain-containing protein [Microcoleus sp. SM1_3_4]|nr:DUF2993 domain-containing protein [Microcoleus sp. SM1_3_4]
MVAALFSSTSGQGQSGDRLVSKVAGAAIAALFKKSEKAEANIRAEPVAKLLQGSIDGFDFIGKGMLMYNGLRIEVMELYLQAVSIDFGAVFAGQVKLRQPTQASMRVVLSQSDLTTSFNTPFVVEKLQRLKYQDESLRFQNTEISFGAEQINSTEVRDFCRQFHRTCQHRYYRSTASRRAAKNPICQRYLRRRRASCRLGQSHHDHVNNLLDLDKFALEGTQLRVDRCRVQNSELVFTVGRASNNSPKAGGK